MKTQQVVILGAGSFAKEVYWAFIDANRENRVWTVLGYVDDDPEKHGQHICGLPVLGYFSRLSKIKGTGIKVICGVGSPKIKEIFVRRAKQYGLGFCSIIHPSVVETFCMERGEGCVVAAGSILCPDVILKNHVSVNLAVTVGHDTILEDYVNLSPGVHLSGNVTVGMGADIGTGAAVIQGVEIGHWSTIGANASVIRDIPPHAVAVGVPTRILKEQKGENSIK